MLRFACPRLKDLATTMRKKYDLRSKMILRNGSDADMLKLDYDLIQIHRTIARHRRNCAKCAPAANSARPASMGPRRLHGEKPLVSFDMAS